MKRCPNCHSASEADLFCRQCGTASEDFPQDSIVEAAQQDAPDERAQQNKTTQIGSRDLSFQAPANRVVPIPASGDEAESPGRSSGKHVDEPKASPRRVRRARGLPMLLTIAVVGQTLATVALVFFVAYTVLRTPQQTQVREPSAVASQMPKAAKEGAAEGMPVETVKNPGVIYGRPRDTTAADARIGESQAVGRELEQKKAELVRVQQKLREIKAQVAQEQHKLDDLLDEKAQLEKTVNGLEVEVAKYEGKVRKKRRDLAGMDGKVRRKSQELANAKLKLKQLKDDIAKTQQRMQGLRDEMATLKGGNGVRRPQTRRAGRAT